MLLMNKKEKVSFHSIKALWQPRRENTKHILDAERLEVTVHNITLCSHLQCGHSGAGVGRPRESVKRQSTHRYNKPSAVVCSLGCL